MSQYDHQRLALEREKARAIASMVNVSMLVRVLSRSSDGTVDVQPLSKVLIDGVFESRPPLLSLPVLWRRTATGQKDIPQYQTGDIGLVVFCDADIDNILLAGGEVEPATDRLHALEDGIFVGGLL